MSTAAEIEAVMADYRRRLEPSLRALDLQLNVMVFRVFAREVCARRARKLRRRGCDVRFIRSTQNGKARYGWMPGPRITWEGLGS